MPLLENCSLRDKHTFHMDVRTRYWADYESVEELRTLLKDSRFKDIPKFPVGGGSNLLFTQDYNGLLLHSVIRDIQAETLPNGRIRVKAGSGIVWDHLVAFSVGQGWSGLENLSGIPGEVGASPVQNIGAYGSEAKDTIVSVEALDVETLETKTFTKEACRFGYRDSIFKNELKNKFIVCHVTYELSTTFVPNLKYGDLNARMEEWGGPSLENVRDAILEIRSSKLPDPEKLGNAGSFFMNPEIPSERFQSLKIQYPEMPNWPLDNGKVKVSAAWCIDRAGWKGKSLGKAAVHDKQALVLVNPGQATASDIIELSNHIIADVETQFGITLKPEVIFI